MDLALTEASTSPSPEELALDFLPGLACAAAYACETPFTTGRGKGQEKEKQHSQHKDKDKGVAGRRAGNGNVKLAPVPSPELLSALAELTKHLKRFHVSQVMGQREQCHTFRLAHPPSATNNHST